MCVLCESMDILQVYILDLLVVSENIPVRWLQQVEAYRNYIDNNFYRSSAELCVCVCVCVQWLSGVQLLGLHGLYPSRPLCPWDVPG